MIMKFFVDPIFKYITLAKYTPMQAMTFEQKEICNNTECILNSYRVEYFIVICFTDQYIFHEKVYFEIIIIVEIAKILCNILQIKLKAGKNEPLLFV